MQSSHSNKNVFVEQIRLVFEQLPYLSAGNLIGTTLIFIIFWNKQTVGNIYIWLTLNLSLVLIATPLLLIRFNKIGINTENASSWSKIIIVVAFIRASIWGLVPLFFYIPDAIEYHLTNYIFAIVGSSLALGTSASFRPTFFVISIPILLPVTIQFFLENNVLHTAFACGSIFYVIVLFYLFNKINKTLLENITLKLQKTEFASQLEEQKAAAENANIEKSRFLAAASHDLRQPLHAQGLFVEELKHRSTDNATRGILNKLERSMKSMHNLFNGLLDISKLDANIIEPKLSTFFLHDLLKNIFHDFLHSAGEKNIILRYCPCSVIVYSDRSLLERIIRNLVANAIMYTNSGKVLIGCRRKHGAVAIEIHDTGIGIPAKEFQNIFNEYYQIHNPERDRRKGIGLGLAIVNRLARLLDYQIKITSSLNKGSCFSFLVPIGKMEDLTTLPIPTTDFIDTDIKAKTILVIDDETEILEGMRTLLQSWGCTAITATSYTEAQQLIKCSTHKIDAIISDYRLRDGDTGINVIQKLSVQYDEPIPGILITGDTAPERLTEATNSGLHLLHKPVPPSKLRALLSYLLTETKNNDKALLQ